MGQVSEEGIKTTGQEGYLLFGPYIQMEPAQYCIRVKGEADRNTLFKSFVDIAYDSGAKILAAVEIKTSLTDAHLAELYFTLSHRIDDFEVRFWVSSGSVIELKTIEIEMVDVSSNENV